MIARLVPALLILAPVGVVSAQLPLLTAPSGTLRIELGGAFHPTDMLRVDGARMRLGERLSTATLDATATPLVSALEAGMGSLLGRPVSGYSLGGIQAEAEQQRGVASIGLGLGISRRVTLSARIPFVSTRTQLRLTTSGTGANVGINPADQSLGTAGGRDQTTAFFTSFDAALTSLNSRITDGAFTTPTARALADQTLAEGTALRNGLFALLADPVRSSAVLPTLASTDGAALLERIAALDGILGTDLNGTRINASPALPAVPLSSSALDALLRAPTGFDLTAPEDLPLVSLGDIELGMTAELLRRGAVGDPRWLGLWAHVGARLSTGKLPRATLLLDQGSGEGQPDIEFGATGEFGRGSFGLRASALLTTQLAGTALERLGSRDQLLRPARSVTLLSRNPGDLITITAEPFMRIAPHFALTGMLQHQRRGTDALTLADPLNTGESIDLQSFVAGTGANATRIGIGLSYAHDGLNREGILKMPVEAGFAIERTISSSSGVVALPLTSRIVFRVYKPVSGR